MIMRLTRKQKNQLRSLNSRSHALDAQDRANIIYKMKKKLRSDLNILEDIDFMVALIPKDHLRKAIKDNDFIRLSGLVLGILKILEYNKPTQRPTQKDIERSTRLKNFVWDLQQVGSDTSNMDLFLKGKFPKVAKNLITEMKEREKKEEPK